jgi:hypothetical protein
MSEPRVLLSEARRGPAPARSWNLVTSYQVIGWTGFALVLAALSDYALALYPFGLGSAEWEMATIGAIVQGLPLLSVGLAALWMCGGGTGRRWLLRIVGGGLIACSVVLFGSLLLFLTDVPAALRATRDLSRLGIYKLVARTLFLGCLFGLAYVVAGVLAVRQSGGPPLKGTVT